jgi:metallophosphoesterase (TIGR00282 family)
VRLLFIADVFGRAGRRVVEERLPGIRRERELDFVVANGENLADGAGITERGALRLLESGVDVITLGNHAFRQRDVYPFLRSDPRIVRPANMAAAAPGRGLTVCTSRDGSHRLAVVNLLGSLYLDAHQNPFAVAEALVEQAQAETPAVLVDFHAEATSEKVAMGRLLDGRATAVIGTHTHVQTSDARILPGGTAYLTDAGMTGPHDSVIGVRADVILSRFQLGLPARFEPAEGGVQLEGAVVDYGADGRASTIEAVRVPA